MLKLLKNIFIIIDNGIWILIAKSYEKYRLSRNALRHKIKTKYSKTVIEKYLKVNHICKLQIGTGNKMHFLDGWLNSCLSGCKGTVYLDATKQFPVENNRFDYIFAEHFIEHITFQQAGACLNECYRILKPGGRIRIVTPDLSALTSLNVNTSLSETQKKYLDENYKMWLKSEGFPEKKELSALFLINYFFYNWGHKFIYDLAALKYVLEKSGFREVRQFKLGCSEDDNLNNIETHHLDTSIEINNYESIAVEAVK